MIERVTISRLNSEWAPKGADDVCLYRVEGQGEALTFGQLAIACGCAQAAAVEARSVLLMNRIGGETGAMRTLADMMNMVKDADEGLTCGDLKLEPPGGGEPITLLQYLERYFGVKNTTTDEGVRILPGENDKLLPNAKLMLLDAIKTQMEKCANESQGDTLKLRSLVTSRDVALRTVTALVNGNTQVGLNVGWAIGNSN